MSHGPSTAVREDDPTPAPTDQSALDRYFGVRVFRGRARNVHPIMYALFAVFLAYFIWGA